MNAKLLGCLVTLGSLGVFADTLYVDINDPNASDEAAEGRGSEALPYKTIQAAVDAAQTDGTVLVKPGVYTNGTPRTVTGYGSSRLVIDKRLTVKSTGGKAVTVIEGKLSSGGGWGSNTARAVLVTADGAGSIVQDFTICNAATANEGNDTGSGAGFMALANAFVADCVVSNCWGRNTGGALWGGTAIRCLFVDNHHGDWTWRGGVLHRANLWYCVVDHWNDNGFGCYNACTNVGCSYFTSGSTDHDRGSVYYNCLENATTSGGTFNNCVTKSSAFFSPTDYDYETVAGVTDYKKGVTADIYAIFDVPASLRGKDFAGNAIDVSDAACTVGAFDQPTVAQYGAISLESYTMPVGGRAKLAPCYLRTRTFPRLCTFAVNDIACFSHGQPYGIPQMDGKTCYYAVPYSPDKVMGTWQPGKTVRYVDQAIGSDETGDGTAEKPFASIQRACDSVSAASYPLIKVAPGTYAPFSLKLNSGYFGRVFATNGCETTFLVGGADTRIAMIGGDAVVIQGFTLTGVKFTTETTGALTSGHATLADCMVSNNVSAAGSLMNAGYAIRTRFVDNTVGNALYEGSGGMGFCLFTGNVCGGSVISGAGNPKIYNCSFYGNTTGADRPLIAINNVYPNNCLFDANGGIFTRHADTGIAPNYVYNYVAGAGSASNDKIVDCNPMFIDPAADDFRVPSNWSSATAGLAGSADAWMADYHNYVQGDLNGATPVLLADGHTPLGCIQGDLCPAVTISAAAGGLAIVGGKVGVNVIEQGQSLTISVSKDPDCLRNARGIVVTEADGTTVTTNLFAETPVWTRTATGAADAYSLEAIYDTAFYVDAENGDDGNSGFAPDAAKKTLAGLFGAIPLWSGDVVYAAPGTYDAGTMDDGLSGATLSRVVVPDGVSLVSTGGKAVTTIAGGGTVTADAVRCASLGKDAQIVGFTLKGGRILNGSGGYGAAVRCAKNAGGTVIDCNLTDCEANGVSVCGAYTTFIRCRADSCRASASRLFHGCTLVSCVVVRSYNGAPCSACTVYNSIILPNYGYYALDNNGEVCKAYNSLLYGPLTPVSGSEYVNCICVTNIGEFGQWGSCLKPGDAMAAKVRFVDLAEIGYVTARPTTAKVKGLMVDAGDSAAVYPFDADTKWDLEGLPRAMNYDVDIGAYEEDIRAEMLPVFGRRVREIGWISSNAVVNAEQRVLLDGDGACVEAVFKARSGAAAADVAIPVTISGTGALTVLVDEGVRMTLTASGTVTLKDLSDGAKIVFSFAGNGSAQLGRITSADGLLLLVR